MTTTFKTAFICTAALYASLCFLPVKSSHATSPASSIHPLTAQQCQQLKAAGILTNRNPVPCSRLREVSLSYVSSNQQVMNDGRLVVLDTIAPQVDALFDALRRRSFYLAKVQPIETFRGDDRASMAANNTSAFNGRPVTGGQRWSLHAYGVAIDINPWQNPYVDIDDKGTARVSPAASARVSLNRLQERPNKERRPGMAEDVVDLFAEHGFFIWGGDWNYPIDYQHFQVGPREFVEKLAGLDPEGGRALLEQAISRYRTCKTTAKVSAKEKRSYCVEQVLRTWEESK